jgi:hypothetical protein
MPFQQTISSSFRVTLPLKKITHLFYIIAFCFRASTLQVVLPENAPYDLPSETLITSQTTQACVPSIPTSSMKIFFTMSVNILHDTVFGVKLPQVLSVATLFLPSFLHVN